MNIPTSPKRAIKMMTGARITWSDTNPLNEEGKPASEITNSNVRHKLPIMNQAAAKLWRLHHEWFVNQSLLWRIEITIVFRYPNGTDQKESRCVVAKNKFQDIGYACDPVIAEAMRYGSNFLRADMSVECLGTREPRDSDFGDFEG